MTEVEVAKRTLAGLQDKLVAARAAEAELKDATKSVSFDAHTGVASARKRLDELHREGAAAALEIGSIEVAIGEAQARVAAAEAAVAAEAEREKARQCAARLPAFKARAKKLDRLVNELKSEMDGLGDDARFFAANGACVNARLVDLATQRAFQAAVDIRSVPPGERHTFPELVLNWSSAVEAFVSERVGDEKKDAA